MDNIFVIKTTSNATRQQLDKIALALAKVIDQNNVCIFNNIIYQIHNAFSKVTGNHPDYTKRDIHEDFFIATYHQLNSNGRKTFVESLRFYLKSVAKNEITFSPRDIVILLLDCVESENTYFLDLPSENETDNDVVLVPHEEPREETPEVASSQTKSKTKSLKYGWACEPVTPEPPAYKKRTADFSLPEEETSTPPASVGSLDISPLKFPEGFQEVSAFEDCEHVENLRTIMASNQLVPMCVSEGFGYKVEERLCEDDGCVTTYISVASCHLYIPVLEELLGGEGDRIKGVWTISFAN